MDENNDIALRGVRYAQDQFSQVVTQAEEFVREKPGQSLLIALLAGFILNRLPIGRFFGRATLCGAGEHIFRARRSLALPMGNDGVP
jgi:hypothetical protein